MDYQNGQYVCEECNLSKAVVSVAFPIAIPGLYDYKIPQKFRDIIIPGTPVLVEVKKNRTWGVAVKLKAASKFANLKEIIDIKTTHWTDSKRSLIQLYEWMANYYKCDIGRVFRSIVRKSLVSSVSKTITLYSVKECDFSTLKVSYQEIMVKLRNINSFTVKQVEKSLNIKRSSITYLYKKGFLTKTSKTVVREAKELEVEAEQNNEIKLTDEQFEAVKQLKQAFHSPDKPFLLHGITGSGKTHIYIEIALYSLKQGKGVIILVPEISLTPQTIRKFKSTLGNVIAVIHSHMSEGERRDSLQEIVSGNKRVIIGVRSAIIAPMDNVGLIIVDEEHDTSYKQSDMEPRYNARDIAVMRGYFQKSLVVLGSATPSLESYYNTIRKKYNKISLTERFGAAALPEVKIVDMAEEHRNNNWSPVSRFLLNRIQMCIENKRQVIILLNRRGFSTVLICKNCGKTCTCPNCSVNMRYHLSDYTLKCHLCGYEEKAPDVCPSCKGEQIKYKGTGIQKIEEYLKNEFPQIRILRMDQDTTRRKGAHIDILNKFANNEADILLGTQMVSKGLDFPSVSLVGVIQADISLHFPDFRAAEKTFQLLTQVAGRAGRSDNSGEVVIQTYFPEDSAILAAQNHDYESFFNSEISSRKELQYPPFGKLARIVVQGKDELKVKSTIYSIFSIAKKFCGSDFKTLGPSSAVLQKIALEYRYSLLIKSVSPSKIGSALELIRQKSLKTTKTIKVIIDVDPVNML